MYLPFYFYPSARLDWPSIVLVRTNDDPNLVLDVLRTQVTSLSPDARVLEVNSGDELFRSFLSSERAFAQFFAGVGGAAFVLAVSGLFAVVAQASARRRREMGIRMALGARQLDVGGLVLRNSLRLAAIGISGGAAIALAASHVMATAFYETSPSDPATLTSVAVLLLVIASVASYYPAREACRVDVVETLRSE